MEEEYESLARYKPRKLSEKTASEEFQETLTSSPVALFTPQPYTVRGPKATGHKSKRKVSPMAARTPMGSSPSSRSPVRKSHAHKAKVMDSFQQYAQLFAQPKGKRRKSDSRRRPSVLSESESSSSNDDVIHGQDADLIQECLMCLERKHRKGHLKHTDEVSEVEKFSEMLDQSRYFTNKKAPMGASHSAKPPPPTAVAPPQLKSVSDGVASRAAAPATPTRGRTTELKVLWDTPTVHVPPKSKLKVRPKPVKDKRDTVVTFKDGQPIDKGRDDASAELIAPPKESAPPTGRKPLKKRETDDASAELIVPPKEPAPPTGRKPLRKRSTVRKPLEIITLPAREPSVQTMSSAEFEASVARETDQPRFEIITLPDTSMEQRVWEEKRLGLLITPFHLLNRRSSLTDLNNLHDQCPAPARSITEKDLKNLVLDRKQATLMAQQVEKMQASMEQLQTIVKKYHCTERYREDIDYILAHIDQALQDDSITIATNT